jgi:hypothetical protein
VQTTTHRDRKAAVRGFADSVTLQWLRGRKQAALGGDLHEGHGAADSYRKRAKVECGRSCRSDAGFIPIEGHQGVITQTDQSGLSVWR